MAQVSNDTVVNLFKEVYGDIQDLLPEDYLLAKDIPFNQKQKVGEKYVEAVVLTNESGITFGGSAMEAFDINPAVAGAVKQAEVTPYMTVLPSIVPWGVIARSAGGGKVAFYDGTKHIMKNNLKSHGKFQEIARLYGQASSLLGYVSYATATYRGVSFTTGTGTLTLNGTSVALTNGVNTTSKWILLAPGSFASGIWVGSEGVTVQQVNSSGTVVAEGALVEVDADKGAIKVDFSPIAATSTTSHRLQFKGMGGSEMLGIQYILNTDGSVFSINNNTYALWKGSRQALSSEKFKFKSLQDSIALAVNRGGLDGDVKVYINPRSWSTLLQTEAGLRMYDGSYKQGVAENGMESITFYHQAGKAEIVAHRFCKEGDAFIMHLADWSRSGSAEISFSIPGMNQEVIYPLQNQAGYAFKSFSDQYVFCHAPAKSIYVSGINDEAAS